AGGEGVRAGRAAVATRVSASHKSCIPVTYDILFEHHSNCRDRLAAVQYDESSRVALCAVAIGTADALEERHVLDLEAVGGLRRRATLRSERRVEVEQVGAVGLQVSVYPVLEPRDALDRCAATGTLVGVGRVGEAVADDPAAIGQRRADEPVEVVSPGREHQ